jgi:hypothetical protein
VAECIGINPSRNLVSSSYRYWNSLQASSRSGQRDAAQSEPSDSPGGEISKYLSERVNFSFGKELAVGILNGCGLFGDGNALSSQRILNVGREMFIAMFL